MLTFGQLIGRLAVAIVLGAVMGAEREFVRKEEAGIRTELLVASGSAIFTMVALVLPYLVAVQTGAGAAGAPAATNIADVVARNSGFLAVIANIVVGIGFLGAGLIIKTGNRPHGITTAALVWTTAAIGILAGLGMWQFAATATVLIVAILLVLRSLNISERLERSEKNGG